MKKWPILRSDAQAEAFVAEADLTEYDLSEMVPVRFELNRHKRMLALELPEELLEAVQAEAERVGVPYQTFVRRALERAIHDK